MERLLWRLAMALLVSSRCSLATLQAQQEIRKEKDQNQRKTTAVHRELAAKEARCWPHKQQCSLRWMMTTRDIKTEWGVAKKSVGQTSN